MEVNAFTKVAGRFAPVATALVLGSIGAVLATIAGMPAPLILGPAILLTFGALAGLRLEIPLTLRDGVFTVIGMVMGSGVTPQVLEAARQWPISFLALAVSLVVILSACTAVLVRGFAYSRRTAILAASPGHLSYVLGLGSAAGGDLMTISVIQSIRLLSLTLLVPPLAAMAGFSLSAPVVANASMAGGTTAALIALSLAGGYLLTRLKVPAGYLLGGMLVSTLAHLTGSVEGSVPGWIAAPCFMVMGTLIGTRFSGVSLQKLRNSLLAGLASTLVAALASAGIALVASWLTGLSPALMLISFAPGGVETMAALALLMHLDPAFVAAHHVFRLLLLTLLVPAWLGIAGKEA
ncbi:MAG: AbrB family transcriptional regulator [Nitratireductor sp.]